MLGGLGIVREVSPTDRFGGLARVAFDSALCQERWGRDAIDGEWWWWWWWKGQVVVMVMVVVGDSGGGCCL